MLKAAGQSRGLDCGLICNPGARGSGDTRHTRQDGEVWWEMVPGMASLNTGVNEWHGVVAAPPPIDEGLSHGQGDTSRCPQPPSPGGSPVQTANGPAVHRCTLRCPWPDSSRPSTQRPSTPLCPGGARAPAGAAGVPSPAVTPPGDGERQSRQFEWLRGGCASGRRLCAFGGR